MDYIDHDQNMKEKQLHQILNYAEDLIKLSASEEYKKTGKGLTYNKCATMIPALKKSNEYSWLKEVDSIALQSSVKQIKILKIWCRNCCFI